MRSIVRIGFGVVLVLLFVSPAAAAEPRFEMQRCVESLLEAWEILLTRALGDWTHQWPETLEKAGPIVDPIGGTSTTGAHGKTSDSISPSPSQLDRRVSGTS